MINDEESFNLPKSNNNTNNNYKITCTNNENNYVLNANFKTRMSGLP